MGVKRRSCRWESRGFTMLEVIAVLVIIGIIAAVAIARIGTTAAYTLDSQAEVVKNHLRYAQSRAMATGNVWGINFTSGTTYHLFQGTATGVALQILGENSPTVDISGSGLVITPPSPPTVAFDGYGSPGATTIPIATNGKTITVTRNTGYIP